MHRVVPLEYRSAKYIVWAVEAYQQKQALRPILCFTYVEYIIFTVDNYPFLLKHEIEIREVCVTFRKYKSFIELIIISSYIFENVLDQIVKVEA